MAEKAKILARRLVATREALGITAAELCRRINCRPNRWSQYETGERPITLIVANRLCDEFRLSLDWIYRGDPSLLPGPLAHRIKSKLAA
jgi:transcriptional regulator with XRE-family HTH domain